MSIELTIAIANYRGADLLRQLLQSIVRSTGVDLVEVCVRDDASPAKDWEQVQQAIQETVRGRVSYILERSSTNSGCVATYNQLFQTARTGLVALIDNDVVLPPQWIQSALGLHAAVRRVGVLSWKSVRLNSMMPVGDRDSGGPLLELATELAGYCYLLSKNLWSEMGGFDEQFRNYQGDSDMCVRLWKAGYKSYRVHYPLVGHQEHATLGLYPEETQADPHGDMARFKEKWGASSSQIQRELLGA